MDIQSIQGGMAQFPQLSNEPLSESQRTSMEEILEKYDPKNLSDEDKVSLMSELKEAGFKPSRESIQLLKDNGFKMREKPQKGMKPDMKQMKPEIKALVEQFQNGDIEKEELQSQMEQYKPNFGEFSGDFLDMFI